MTLAILRPVLRLAPLMLAMGAMAVPGGAAPARPEAKRPQRIVSLNLCADQYLLDLADPGQIAGLTRNATDPDMSAGAARAKGMRILGESAEEVLAIDPDLVIGFSVGGSGLPGVLGAQGYRFLGISSADSYADIVSQIREVASAVGHPERGEALVRRMDAALAALPRPVGHGVAAYYQRRGYMTGTGTLVDDLMRRVGLVNLSGKLGKPVLAQVPLEELVAARPDYLIVESATDRVTDQGTEMLHHPLLKDIPRLRLPQAWTVCGGPAYVLAARSLMRQLEAARRERRAITTTS